MNRRDVLKAGTAATLMAGAPAIVRAQPYKAEYRMSTLFAPPFSSGAAAQAFANLVRERTSGRINIRQFAGASLVQGQQDREFSAMRQGIIDVLVGSPVNWSGTVKECGAWALPFLFPDHKAFDAVMISDVVTKDFFDIIRRAGAEPLATGEVGYRQITNSRRAILVPDDLKGLKIRVPTSPMYQEIMGSLGANPAAMTLSDLPPAMASGSVDGQENPLELFMRLQIHKQGQKFATKWNYSNDMLLFAVANPIWQGWSSADQSIVRDCAQEAARQNIAAVRRAYANDIADCKALGVNVHVPTPSEMEAWQIVCRRPYARWKALANPQLVSKAEAVIASTRKL